MTAAPASHRASPRAKFCGAAAIALLLVLAAWLGVALVRARWPVAVEHEPATPQAAGLVGFRDVTVMTPGGQRLDAWWAPPLPGRGVVLFLHGSPGILAGTAGHLADLQRSGLGAMAIDYSGFGRSTGHPSQRGLRLDADAAFDWLRRAAPRSRIAVFGESLGTYPAVALASERPVAGVLLNAPFASLRRLWIIRGRPAERWLTDDPFDSRALVGEINAPLLVLQGTADRIVPLGEAERLFAAARPPKKMIVVPGAGHIAAYQGAAQAQALAALVRWTGGADAGR